MFIFLHKYCHETSAAYYVMLFIVWFGFVLNFIKIKKKK